jgi:hypothetical protein
VVNRKSYKASHYVIYVALSWVLASCNQHLFSQTLSIYVLPLGWSAVLHPYKATGKISFILFRQKNEDKTSYVVQYKTLYFVNLPCFKLVTDVAKCFKAAVEKLSPDKLQGGTNSQWSVFSENGDLLNNGCTPTICT